MVRVRVVFVASRRQQLRTWLRALVIVRFNYVIIIGFPGGGGSPAQGLVRLPP